MSSLLERRAEILKLARLLQVEPDELDALREADPAQLRALRDAVTDHLFDSDARMLEGLASATKLVPTGAVAGIAQRHFGPLLCARTAGLVEPRRAVDIAAGMPTDFLADMAIEIDPRRASTVLGRMPTDQVVDVARELARRSEYVAMGRFVGHLSDEAIAAVVRRVDDPTLLHCAFMLEEKERLDAVVRLLPPSRLRGLLRAAHDERLWPEALDLIGQLEEDLRERFAEVAGQADDALIESLLEVVSERRELWAELLPLVALLPEDSQRLVADAVRALDAPERAEVARLAAGSGLDGPVGEAFADV